MAAGALLGQDGADSEAETDDELEPLNPIQVSRGYRTPNELFGPKRKAVQAQISDGKNGATVKKQKEAPKQMDGFPVIRHHRVIRGQLQFLAQHEASTPEIADTKMGF